MTVELVETFESEFNGIEISQYKSKATGLQVIHVKAEGPLVSGFFALATEALDDDGCPHTLEHLVFLGSQDYPFKGVLDTLANRALARGIEGTNAWTDVDHTCYTLTTAGPQGFLDMLPIYLDHILYPTLTYSGYYTEVHHITGTGENAGVVYSEMQGRENTGPDLMQLALQRLVFPGTGYQSETGGLMKNLRGLKVDKIREYHRDFYRVDNLCLVIVGRLVDESKLVTCLNNFDSKVLSKNDSSPAPAPVSSDGQEKTKKKKNRPWINDQSQKPRPLDADKHEIVKFPDEDESIGSVYVAWTGPKYSEYLECIKLFAMADYLTDSVISLLQREFVELEDPFATLVSFHFQTHLQTMYLLDFDGVPVDKLSQIHKRLLEVLQAHVSAGSSDGSNKFDMKRMHLVLDKLALKQRLDVETDPPEFFIKPCIHHFLYGMRSGELSEQISYLSHLEKLKQEMSEADWKQIIIDYFINRPSAVIIGEPSASLAKELQSTESARVEAQRTELGPEKLKQLAEALEKAKAENEAPIPPEIFQKVPIPSTDSISLLPIDTLIYPAHLSPTSGGVSQKLFKKVAEERERVGAFELPFSVQLDEIKSHFVTIRVHIDTRSLDNDLRPYLPIYMDTFFHLPLLMSADTSGASTAAGVETIVPHEQVVEMLEQDTLEYENSVGFSSDSFLVGAFGQTLIFELRVERHKYDRAVTWFRDLFFKSQFDPHRLIIGAKKLLNDIPNYKRDGSTISRCALSGNLNDQYKSNSVACHILKQEQFLSQLLKQLGAPEDDKSSGSDSEGSSESSDGETEKDGEDVEIDPAVMESLQRLRYSLLKPENWSVHVYGHVSALEAPLSPWIRIFGSSSYRPPSNPRPQYSKEVQSQLGMNPQKTIFMVSMPATESAFVTHVTRGPDSFEHPDYPALRVLNEYLTTMEGPFWKEVRGTGLAYGTSISIDLEAGLLYFLIYRSPEPFKAFNVVKEILSDMASGKIKFEEKYIDAAKSSIVYSVVSRLDTALSSAEESFVDRTLKQVGANHSKELLKKISDVTVGEMERVLLKYVQKLFSPDSSCGAIAIAPNKVDERFKDELGFDIKHVTIEDMCSFASPPTN